MWPAKELLSRNAHITNNFRGQNRHAVRSAGDAWRWHHFRCSAGQSNNWLKSFAPLTRDVRKLRFRPPLSQTLATKAMITELIKKIKSDEKCCVEPPSHTIKLPDRYVIPDELIRFYNLCSGITLFPGKDYSWRILGPHEIQNACQKILGETCEQTGLEDFFVIATDGNGDFLAIQLGEHKNGVVIDAFHETFGLQGDTPVIASSLTELITRIYEGAGGHPYWLKDKTKVHHDWFDFKNQ